MEIQSICENVVKESEGALGCLVIDLKTGLVIASAHRPGLVPDEYGLATVLRSAGDLFRGHLLEQFVQALPTNRPSAIGFVREVQISTPHSYQFMGALPNWQDGLILLITERTISLGIGWMAIHSAQQQFENSRDGAVQAAVDRALESQPEPSKEVERPAPLRPPEPTEPTPPTSMPDPVSQPPAPASKATASSSTSQDPLIPVRSEPTTGSTSVETDDQPEVRPPLGPRGRMFKPRKSRG